MKIETVSADRSSDPSSGGSGLRALRSRADRIAEALEQGLSIPWMGLRPDLRLHKGDKTMTGKQTYVVEDPVTGHHFEIGEAEARFFLCLVTEDTLRGAVGKLLRTTSFRPSVEDILGFLRMLQQEMLASLPEEEARNFAETRRKAEDRMKKLSWLKIKRKIMFVQVPLFRPDAFLTRIYPWLAPFWSKPFQFMYAVLGVVGLVLVVPQIELYFHTAAHLFTPAGALMFFFALSFVKTIHELGHALATKRHGLYVRRMGIYFMVFVPILYTDATEAWKLPDRRSRVMIGAAGVLVELAVAAVSLFLWTVLPDGLLRSLMFYLSGVSLISSFLVNLNPLMRFDGYYILMDYLRISSLRTRSIRFFQYYRRRLLVDWQGAKPEEHPWDQAMAVFGLFSALYMIIIFLGIAMIIYHKASSLLGVFFLAQGLLMVVIAPILKEIYYLLKHRKQWGSPFRVGLTLTAFAGLVALFLVPLPTEKRLPAHFLYRDVVEMKSPGRGRLAGALPAVGKPVERGELLFRIQDDRTEQELTLVRFDLERLEATLRNTGGGGEEGAYRNWLLAERERLRARAEKLREMLAQMEIRAPVSGRVLDVNPTLRGGGYVYPRAFLVTVGRRDHQEIRGYAGEKVYRELAERRGQIDEGKVMFRDLETPAAKARLRTLLDFPASDFPNEALFDFAGGPILSVADSRSEEKEALHRRSVAGPPVRARDAHFPVFFDLQDAAPSLRHGTPCNVRVRLRNASLMERTKDWLWRNLADQGLV
ncbi:MAG: site-2 protease family protein [Desulfococcaceae bacterium]